VVHEVLYKERLSVAKCAFDEVPRPYPDEYQHHLNHFLIHVVITSNSIF
jgi:hypothetical protein